MVARLFRIKKNFFIMDTILVIIGAIVAIICIVAIYYLLKLILGYVGFAVIGAVVFGVIGAVAAKFLFPANMIDITLYSAGAGAVLGLVLGILNTMDFLKSPLASEIAKDIMEGGDPVGTEYTVRDQYGHTKKVKKTGRGILGETYLEDENGNGMVKDACSNDVRHT